jgi:hypothetical protein
LFHPRLQQLDRFGDPLRSYVGAAFGGIDPAQIGPLVELGERVEERARRRARLQRRGYILGEVRPLRALRRQHHGDVRARLQTAPQPGGAEQKAALTSVFGDHRADTHPTDRARHMVHRLGRPYDVRVERHRDEHPSSPARPALNGVALLLHTPILPRRR